MESQPARAAHSPGIEDAGAKTFLRCPVCSVPNEMEVRYCSNCRAPLRGARTVTADEAEALIRKRQRDRTIRKWRIPAFLAACLLVALGVLYVRTRPPDPLPRPASNVTASSQPGVFTELGYDAQHSNHVTGVPSFKGEVRWTFQTAEPFTSSPTATLDTVYVGSGDRRIIALDAETGALRWEFATGGPVDASPAIAGDWLFAGLRDGRLVSLDRRTGELRWAVDTGTAIGASPIVVDGEVYTSNGDGRLTVLDAATGKLRWRTGFDRAEGPVTRSGNVVITVSETHYYLWDARNGAYIHSYPTGASASTAAAVSGTTTFVGDFNGSVWAADITYRPEWYTKGPGRRWLNQLYVWDLGPRPPNGTLWAKAFGRDIIYPFALDGTTMYLPDSGGVVRSVDTTNRTVRWSKDLGQGPATGAVLAGDTLLVSEAAGVHALDPATGAVRWTAIGVPIPSAPSVTANGIYAAGENGVVYALR